MVASNKVADFFPDIVKDCKWIWNYEKSDPKPKWDAITSVASRVLGAVEIAASITSLVFVAKIFFIINPCMLLPPITLTTLSVSLLIFGHDMIVWGNNSRPKQTILSKAKETLDINEDDDDDYEKELKGTILLIHIVRLINYIGKSLSE